MRTRTRHPAFLALCVLASREDWCWSIHCGTCGHWHFRLGLVELVRGKHPADRDWVVKVANREVFDAFADVGNPLLTKAEQAELSRIVSETRIRDLARHCRFPDWLGYLGLALRYTSDWEDEARVLTSTLAPQFLEMVPEGSSAWSRFREMEKDGSQRLDRGDLELVEWAMDGTPTS
jgi:hypothetical protein